MRSSESRQACIGCKNCLFSVRYYNRYMIINDVPVDCINIAAIQYHVPAVLIISVLKTEGGRLGDARLNKNGSIDYGPMQINSVWLDTLGKYGYTVHDLQYDPCLNVSAGTWILAQAIAEDNTPIWKGIGNYHSHSYAENLSYQYKVSYYTNLLESILKGKK
jgi:hypothetical protein